MLNALGRSIKQLVRSMYSDTLNIIQSKSYLIPIKTRYTILPSERQSLMQVYSGSDDQMGVKMANKELVPWVYTTINGEFQSLGRTNLMLIMSGDKEWNRFALTKLIRQVQFTEKEKLGILLNLDFHDESWIEYDYFTTKLLDSIQSSLVEFCKAKKLDFKKLVLDILVHKYDSELMSMALATVAEFLSEGNPNLKCRFSFDPSLLEEFSEKLPIDFENLFLKMSELAETGELNQHYFPEQSARSTVEKVTPPEAIFEILRMIFDVLQLENRTQTLSDLNSIEFFNLLLDCLDVINGTSSIPNSFYKQDPLFFEGDESAFKQIGNVCLFLRLLIRGNRNRKFGQV